MAKKTKKQKILAQYRRKLQLIKQQEYSNKPIKSKVVLKKTEENNNLIQNPSLDNSYFINDLKKSLLITFLIIALEITIYFVKLIK